jgi:hypothetical protein
MDGIDDLRAVDPLQIHRRDPEVRVPELALDHFQRQALARHLNRVHVAQLMRREAAAHARPCGDAPQLLANARRRQ